MPIAWNTVVMMRERARSIVAVVAFAVAAVGLSLATVPTAAAESCSDIEVVFARGTDEPPGLGSVGQPFIDGLRTQVGGRSVDAYAVAYPADGDIAKSLPVGAADVTNRVESTIARCPDTKVVIGGYSQGAGAVELATNQLSSGAGSHVAAVVLFGAPRSGFAQLVAGGALPSLAGAYSSKLVESCLPGDPVCDGGWNFGAHNAYVSSGAVQGASTVVAGRV